MEVVMDTEPAEVVMEGQESVLAQGYTIYEEW